MLPAALIVVSVCNCLIRKQKETLGGRGGGRGKAASVLPYSTAEMNRQAMDILCVVRFILFRNVWLDVWYLARCVIVAGSNSLTFDLICFTVDLMHCWFFSFDSRPLVMGTGLVGCTRSLIRSTGLIGGRSSLVCGRWSLICGSWSLPPGHRPLIDDVNVCFGLKTTKHERTGFER